MNKKVLFHFESDYAIIAVTNTPQQFYLFPTIRLSRFNFDNADMKAFNIIFGTLEFTIFV